MTMVRSAVLCKATVIYMLHGFMSILLDYLLLNVTMGFCLSTGNASWRRFMVISTPQSQMILVIYIYMDLCQHIIIYHQHTRRYYQPG
ncbi:hypothetical protein BDB01DRAFT_791293 [Pilobolus umbonatus]|nr:hypothetical protein BDB01DRAFT_791293 [Pilobolus umbonatus]